MAQRYAYEVEGTARGAVPWKVTGEVYTDRLGDFPKACLESMREAFERLTDGRAVYGDLSTCQGPYRVWKLIIELKESTDGKTQ